MTPLLDVFGKEESLVGIGKVGSGEIREVVAVASSGAKFDEVVGEESVAVIIGGTTLFKGLVVCCCCASKNATSFSG